MHNPLKGSKVQRNATTNETERVAGLGRAAGENGAGLTASAVSAAAAPPGLATQYTRARLSAGEKV